MCPPRRSHRARNLSCGHLLCVQGTIPQRLGETASWDPIQISSAAAWAEPWKSMNGVDPPRGFAFAWFKIGNQDVGVYSVHLKSNLITRGDREAEAAKNIRKREVAIAQLLTHIRDVIEAKMPSIKGVVIGGDFNTNHDQAMFAAERTLDSLADSGYQNGFEGLPL